MKTTQLILKSFFDRGLAFFGLVLFFPVIFIIGLLIKRGSPGPVFFVQKRVGKQGNFFFMYKFRSMYVTKSDNGVIPEGMSAEEARLKYKTTVKDDPRITPIGKFIRKYFLDELPQLINVLKGEMSLVGPRPYTPSEVVDYKPTHWESRHSVKPGITGLSQLFINGRKGKHYSRICLDIAYIKNQSFSLDIYILFKTFFKLIKGAGF